MSKWNEDNLIEQPAIEIFEELGYEYLNCYHETFGDGGTLGRENTGEVVLVRRLKSALTRLNPDVPTEAVQLAVEELTMDRRILNPANANKEVYKHIRNGVKVSIKKPDGSWDTETVKVVDFDNPENNDFFLASQLWVTGEMYKRRADLVGFVNGIPLIFIELKAIHRKLENAYNENLTDYKDSIPQLFWYNAICILSNGAESRIGSFTADYSHFSEWKKINSEGEEGIVSLDTIIKGTCQKSRFIDLLENFILYQNEDGAVSKIVARNHQFIGVNNAVESFGRIKENQGKLGVFWHTQGSGKSFSMIFFSQKVLRKFEGNYTFLIVTDRKELDEQIYGNFASVGAVTEGEVHATSGEHLKQLLGENHRNIFTLIHKFGDIRDVVSERSDIIVITDEAHRSQYDTLALNMRTALPNAAFIAFTGTPLMAGEEKTKDTFGDYISVYNFKQSVDDNATVPLYYENRIPEVQIKNEDLNDDLERIIEAAMLDEEQEKKLQREFSREYHIITRDDRLEKIAEDVVAHFVSRGHQGKAMMICIDKPTAVKMYDKVKAHWKAYIKRLELKLNDPKTDHGLIKAKISYMQETDMAVVVSSEQNEIKRFKALGLDIETHRKRMVKEDLAEKFKDPDNPLRLVFVCAMWMTGFDAKPISTIYMDKPMKNHTLMQTIARANRVFKDKQNGLIVDYIGIFRNLQKALAIYGGGPAGEEPPIKPKEELIKALVAAIAEADAFCRDKGVDTAQIIKAGKLERIKLVKDAAGALVAYDATKRRFLLLAGNVKKLFKAILPDLDANKYYDKCALFKVLADSIRLNAGEVDISEVLGEVSELLDESIEAKGYVITEVLEDEGTPKRINLSQIDFDALREKFEKQRKYAQAERLRNAINDRLIEMVRLNMTRMDYLEKFQQLIDEYNSGTMNVETLFDQLIRFARDLNKEDGRKISEQLTEEELALFDLLKKPELKGKERQQVKLASKDLLRKLNQEKLVLDWRRKQQSRAEVLFTIETVLDEMLPDPPYGKAVYEETCQAVYHHVYDSYYGAGKSIYTATL